MTEIQKIDRSQHYSERFKYTQAESEKIASALNPWAGYSEVEQKWWLQRRYIRLLFEQRGGGWDRNIAIAERMYLAAAVVSQNEELGHSMNDDEIVGLIMCGPQEYIGLSIANALDLSTEDKVALQAAQRQAKYSWNYTHGSVDEKREAVIASKGGIPAAEMAATLDSVYWTLRESYDIDETDRQYLMDLLREELRKPKWKFGVKATEVDELLAILTTGDNEVLQTAITTGTETFTILRVGKGDSYYAIAGRALGKRKLTGEFSGKLRELTGEIRQLSQYRGDIEHDTSGEKVDPLPTGLIAAGEEEQGQQIDQT